MLAKNLCRRLFFCALDLGRGGKVEKYLCFCVEQTGAGKGLLGGCVALRVAGPMVNFIQHHYHVL